MVRRRREHPDGRLGVPSPGPRIRRSVNERAAGLPVRCIGTRARYLQEFPPPPPAQQLDDVLARQDVAENSVESRERRLVQPVRLAGQRVLDHDDVVVELHCVARPRFGSRVDNHPECLSREFVPIFIVLRFHLGEELNEFG
jgi:hypothetical protein